MNRLASMLRGADPLRTMLVLAALLLAGGLLVVAGCGSDDANVTFPQAPEEPDDPWYYAVSGTGADDVWVAGNTGVVYHYDGSGADGWTRMDVGATKAITSLYAVGDGSHYACGHGGGIWRITGSSWSSMSSGTGEDLYRLGNYQRDIYAVGANGTALKLESGAWRTQPGFIVTRNPKEGNAVVDSLNLYEDVVSLAVVNYYMLGGAYLQRDLEEEPIGTGGTIGFTIKDDEPIVDPGNGIDETGLYDWLLTSVGEESQGKPEWVICSLSSDGPVTDNWFGTSKGWLFRLTEDVDTGARNWVRYGDLAVTDEDRYGVRALWQAANGDIYIVTDQGQIVHQQPDGTRKEIYNQLEALVSIWGTGPDNLYVTGYMDEEILHVDHDPMDASNSEDDITVVTPITLEFPDTAAKARSDSDELGRPRS